jgi:hypothetical protein
MIRIPRARWTVPFLALGVLAVAGCDDDDPVGPNEGDLRVTVTATGAPADPDGFTVLLDGVDIGDVNAAGGNVDENDLDVGEYEVELDGVAANCTGDNPRTVNITRGNLTTTTFAVTCAAAAGGTVSITTVTTGDNPDADGFEVSVAGGTPQAIAANATLDVTDVAPGDVPVALTGVAGNCAVTEDNPATVTVTAGGTSATTFTVTCALNAGSAEVTMTTTGTNQDADGYELTVDGGTPIPVADVNGTVIVPNLTPGDHDFTIGGVAANCTVTGGVDQTITIVDQQTAAVAYAIACT